VTSGPTLFGFRRARRLGIAAAAVLATAALLGCTLGERVFGRQDDRVLPVRLPEASYEALFPHYAELCAVSRFHRIGVERGGSAGHAVLYLKGVCRDPDAPFPTLEMCPERVDDIRDPRHGTGVSVNAAFANVNWVAYPGRHLFFNGNLEPGETLDQAHFEATLHAIVDQGLLRGVDVHEDRLTGVLPGLSPEERLAESLLGTDVAIRFARSVWCAGVPLERAQVERAVAHLNELNARRSFSYSLFFDNCVDTLHNTLAAAGVWAPKRPAPGLLRSLVTMGVPANEVVRLASRTNLFPIEDFDAVRDDDAMMQSLDAFGWLPTRQASLLKSAPVHRPNQLYDTSLQMYVVQGPDSAESELAERMFSDGRFTDLSSNLQYYEERYTKILESQDDGWWPRSDAYREQRRRYLAYVSEQLADVRSLSERLFRRSAPEDATTARRR
jgi:hypothetical protein